MIIVSQDGKNIINFDNVINIGIQDYKYNLDSRDASTEIDAVFTYTKSIIAWLSNNKSIILGTYLSLDRAKEILKEFVNFYILDDKKEAIPALDVLAYINIRDHAVVYMPEE